MSLVDVPMYLARRHEAAVAGDSTLSLAQGLWEILARCTVVRDRASWSVDIPWLTLYFSTAVWIASPCRMRRPWHRIELIRARL